MRGIWKLYECNAASLGMRKWGITPLFPQRAQARGLAFRIRERDIGELAAIGFGHAGHSLVRWRSCQERRE